MFVPHYNPRSFLSAGEVHIEKLEIGSMAQWQSSCPIYARPWFFITPYAQKGTKSTLPLPHFLKNCCEGYNFEGYRATRSKCLVKQPILYFNIW